MNHPHVIGYEIDVFLLVTKRRWTLGAGKPHEAKVDAKFEYDLVLCTVFKTGLECEVQNEQCT